MNDNFMEKAVINNEYDFSNILPTIDAVAYLVQYCDQMYKQLLSLVDEDENKNIQFKEEYKEYMYKKSYSMDFEVYITEKGYSHITCNDYASFLSAISNGNLKEVNNIDIKLNLDFGRGRGNDIDKHENLFEIKFKPYEITFLRKSNYDDPTMKSIEDQFIDILNKFPVCNTIFCTKD